MKKIASLFICSCIAMLTSQAFTQGDSLTIRKAEFGFNCVPLISNLMPFSEAASTNSSDILLIYKRKLGEKRNNFFRSGIQFSFLSDGNSSGDVLLNLRLGFEKKKYVAKSWIFHTGAEVFTSLIAPRVGDLDRGELGIAGVLGFQWMINKRMGLGTEGYITLSYIDEDSGQGGDLKGIDSGIVVPRSLFFSVYF